MEAERRAGKTNGMDERGEEKGKQKKKKPAEWQCYRNNIHTLQAYKDLLHGLISLTCSPGR